MYSNLPEISEENILRLHRHLAESRRIAVVSHTHPDGDAIGSTAAMYSFLRESLGKTDVRVVLPNRSADFLDFIPGERTTADESRAEALEAIRRSDLLVCLDFNTPERTDCLEGAIRESSATKILIDHHISPETQAFDLVFSKQDISSACELLFNILMDMPQIGGDAAKLPSDCRVSLMAGMTTDTNNFANSVYPGTLRMASELLAAGVDRDSIIRSLYSEYRENRVRAMGWLLFEKMRLTPYGFAYIIIRKSESLAFGLEEGETEGLVNIPLSIGKVKVSALLKEDDGYFRVSLRSKKEVSVNGFAREWFHGGGHAQASGGRLYFPQDIDGPDDVENYLLRSSEHFLKH